jgi:hypothetical protein
MVQPSVLEVSSAGLIPFQPRYRSNRRWKYQTVASVFYGSESGDSDRSIYSNVWFLTSCEFYQEMFLMR